MKLQTLAEWLAWQEQLHPSEIELGLERVKTVARHMPFFAPAKKIVTLTVGGTNGKGSCVAYLEAILVAAGYRVGAYSSPHLLRYNERVRINGQLVSDEALCASFAAVDAARHSIQPAALSLTYFEFGTLAALDIFFNEKVDIQILEVGLGGRLDAVNIMEPDAAVVVNVALDHEAWLGDNREAIGVEKAGIFRAGIPLVIGESKPPLSLYKAAADLHNTHVQIYGKHFVIKELQDGWSFRGLTPTGETVHWPGLPAGSLPLPSAACALQVLCSLGLADRAAVARGLQTASLPGRCQHLEWQGRHIILDVAHNPAGAHYLSEWLARWLAARPPGVARSNIAVVFSALADKDHAAAMAELAALADNWYLAALPVARAATLEKLLESAVKVGGSARGFDTIGAAVQAALAEAQQGDLVLVCGSFYTVSEALRFLQNETQSTR